VDKERNGVGRYVVASLITVAALILATTHLIRDSAAIDAVFVWLFLIAIFPWAGSFVRTFEIFGMKGELRGIESRVDEAHGAAENATRLSEFALNLAETKSKLAEASGREKVGVTQAPKKPELDKLASEYVETRKRMKAGSERTSKMSAIFGKMAAIAGGAETLDVQGQLSSDDPGQRLVGYAYLYSRPDPALLDSLVESVTGLENKPFGQYWGIVAIGRVIDAATMVSAKSFAKLKQFQAELRRSTDRHFALSRILDDLPKSKIT
jgi:hypothetical protein